jgi:hypothetical protein
VYSGAGAYEQYCRHEHGAQWTSGPGAVPPWMIKSNKFLKLVDLHNNQIGIDSGAVFLLAEGLSQSKKTSKRWIKNNILNSSLFWPFAIVSVREELRSVVSRTERFVFA